jgi:hypothetical protein
VSGVAVRDGKRTVSREGLSRAAILALVAAGVDMAACDSTQTIVTHYGAPCAPTPCVLTDGDGGSERDAHTDASPPRDAKAKD